MKVSVHYWSKRSRKSRWVVSFPQDGKRVYRCFSSEAAAMAEASRLRTDRTDDGKAFLSLPPAEQDRLVEAWVMARQKKLNLYEMVVRADAAAPSSPTISAVVSELLEVKRKAGKSKPYVGTLRLMLEAFAKGREEMQISAFGLPEIELWLDKKELASRSTWRARLSTLFKFAVRRGYIITNPCSRLEPVTYKKPSPQVFTVEQAKSCWSYLAEHRPRALAWFALSTFCGLRPEEAEAIRRRNIHIKEGWVRVEISKVRQRRVVYPRPEAMLALKRAMRVSELPLASQPRRRTIRALREHLGWEKWPKDITRHSAASYWLAAVRSAADVAESLGHSEKILNRDYKALVTQQQASEWWEMVGALSLLDNISVNVTKDYQFDRFVALKCDRERMDGK